MTNHLVTCIILALYSANVVWYGWQGDWGRMWYWFAAGQITVCATWLVRY